MHKSAVWQRCFLNDIEVRYKGYNINGIEGSSNEGLPTGLPVKLFFLIIERKISGALNYSR